MEASAEPTTTSGDPWLESMWEMANPQPRYKAILESGPVHCPADGFALIAGRAELEAVMTRKVFSPLGADEYLRVTVGEVGGRMVATPLARGAGVITSLVRADGLVCIPRQSEGLNAGDSVTVRLYRSLQELERTIVAIGSHDLTLDLIAQFLAEKGARLSSANVGSQGGLIALRRGEAHFAGSHLLDPETGEYNLSYIRQYLPEIPVVVLTLVGRE